MADAGRVPPGLDVTKPNIARVYDAFLGGKDNFAVDRQVVDFALQVTPDAPVGARANRAFLRRVVRYLTAQVGMRQLVDIGSGLPTQGNVHEVAQINDDEDPAGIVAQLRAELAPGSYLAISSFRMPGPEHPEDAAKTAAMEKLFNEKLGTGRWRDHEEILAWFGDWDVLDPGLVPLPEWRPDVRGQVKKNATYYGFVGGVARKP